MKKLLILIFIIATMCFALLSCQSDNENDLTKEEENEDEASNENEGETKDEASVPGEEDDESNEEEIVPTYLLKTTCSTDEYGNAGTYTEVSKYYAAGDEIELVATVNDGYNFLGWYVGTTCISEDLKFTFTMKAQNLTIQPRYNYFTLTTSSYTDDNGMAGTYTEKNAEKISIGKKVTLCATVKNGYNFEGWYINDTKMSGDLLYNFEMPKRNVHIYARYSYYELTVEGMYQPSDSILWHNVDSTVGTYSNYNETKVTVGKGVKLVATVKDGYNFEGWYLNNTKLSSNLTYVYTMPRENIKIEARYSSFTLNTSAYCYYASGGSCMDFDTTMGSYSKYDEFKVSKGTTITLTASVKTGYKFLGWINGNGNYVTTGTTYAFVMEKEDVYFEAVYQELN